MTQKGRIIIISGPSGTGKGTIVIEYMDRRAFRTKLSVSATTRSPRPTDVEGETYFFYTKERFLSEAENGGMLEYAEYCGNYYGTPREPIERWSNEGKDVILEIEVQGGLNVKSKNSDVLMVFVMPPSAEVLRDRLTGRGTETEETLNARLTAAIREMDEAEKYDYILVNDNLSDAVDELERVIDSGLRNVDDMMNFVKGVQNDVKTLCK